MNILIIRTIQSDLLGALINSLKDSYPNSTIYLHANQKQKSFTKAQKNINEKIFWTRKRGDYGISNISWKTIIEIRKVKFDKVVVPHKQYYITGFDNVTLLLYFLRIKSWYHCSVDWRLKKIERLYLVKIFLNKIFTIPIFLILFPISLLSFLYLFVTERILSLKRKNIENWKCDE
ncbi:hypothetical protein HQ571_04730 [Candidatus Kuenenbacteria bacterium]|nr:hypothetical protein [Candidatus Kuenenbacteria bacterium]